MSRLFTRRFAVSLKNNAYTVAYYRTAPLCQTVITRSPFYKYFSPQIAHLHTSVVQIERVGQSARFLPINVKAGGTLR